MKKTMIAATVVVALFMSGLAFVGAKAAFTPCVNASVSITNELGIFAYSKPLCKYDILGTVKLPGLVSSERADRCVETLCKRAKKDFPSTEALIVNEQFSVAECIRFKE